MDKIQYVTLSIPKDILRKAMILAANKNTSRSGLLTQTPTDSVVHQKAYGQAQQRNIILLRSGFNLGSQVNVA